MFKGLEFRDWGQSGLLPLPAPNDLCRDLYGTTVRGFLRNM